MAVKHTKREIADINLIMLAALAALLIGAFVFFSYGKNVISSPIGPQVKTMTIKLEEQNASGEQGTAVLKEVEGKMMINLNLEGAPKSVSQPAHIHLGSCPNPAAVKYPLKSPINGESQTILDTTFDKLEELGPLAINVHKSSAQSSVYVACGNLSF